MQTTVKNTFLEIVEPNEHSSSSSRRLLRSKSEDDLSCSSSGCSSDVVSYSSYKGRWLPTSMLPWARPPSDWEKCDKLLMAKGSLDARPQEISPWAQNLLDPTDQLSATELLALGDDLLRGEHDPSSAQSHVSANTQIHGGGSRVRPLLRQLRASDRELSSDGSISPAAPHEPTDGSREERACKRSVAPAGADETSEDLVARYGNAFDIPREVLRELEQQGLLRDIPISSSGLTSVGSIGHAQGKCVPCPYWFRDMCTHGVRCHHCHFVHEGQKPKRLRPSKNTRHRIKALEQAVRDGRVPDKECLHNMLAYGSDSVQTTSTSASGEHR